MTTDVPAGPLDGEKLVIVGTEMVKSLGEVAVVVPIVNDIVPVAAFCGTVAIICVDVTDVTAAGSPLNLTTLFAAYAASKSCPVMVTDIPGTPEVGEKPAIAG
jgi:hypothetical protein